MSLTLNIDPKALEAIWKTAKEIFPEECCGVMLGKIDFSTPETTRTVSEVHPILNTKGENRERRYLIDPKELLAMEKLAKEKGKDVVGIFHSHPNHPSEYSEFDKNHAMPFWSYLIVSVIDGEQNTVQSWRLRDDRSVMDEEHLVVIDE